MELISKLRKRHPFVRGVAVLAVILAIWVAYQMAAPRWPWVFYRSKARAANKVIAAVNSFQSRNGRLPNSLADVGLEDFELGPVYYRKTSDRTYVVWFGTVIGESATYESATNHRYRATWSGVSR